MAKAEVTAGICGFKTEIEATADAANPFLVHLQFDSPCKAVQRFGDELKDVDALVECTGRSLSSSQAVVFECGRNCLSHAACPVPVAVIKAVEIAAGLALPKDVEIKLTKE